MSQATEQKRAEATVKGLAIVCEGVEKDYGTHKAVRGITLSVPTGECLAILGPNGAGKTTLFKMLLGLIRPTAGKLAIGGNTPGSAAVQAAIGFLPESVAFDRAATGEEMLTYLARLKGAPLASCSALLTEVGLGEASRRRIGTYSKGMRQRLGLAQALLGSPRLMLLDEPTSGLDPDLRRQFYAIIKTLRARGITIVIASHALSEIETVADRFAIIDRGKLMADGPLDSLKAKAGLPVRMRISVPEGEALRLAESFTREMTVTRVNGRQVEIECDESNKIAVVRTITELDPPIGDLEIAPPTLEVLYEYFTRKEGAA